MTPESGRRRMAAIAAIAVCLPGACGLAVGDDATKPVAMTRWAHDAPTQGDPFYSMAYPRPQLCRPDGVVLNGLWDCATTGVGEEKPPGAYPEKVLVPFPIGSPLSRVPRPEGGKKFWYRRTAVAPQSWDVPRRRAVLHFLAIDGNAVLYVNGKEAGSHRGHGAFDADVTDALHGTPGAMQEIVVAVTGAGAAPCDGIWQTVWMEPLAAEHVERLEIAPDPDSGGVAVTAHCTGDAATQHVDVEASDAGALAARAGGKPGERILLTLAIPKLWSPDRPSFTTCGWSCRAANSGWTRRPAPSACARSGSGRTRRASRASC